MTQRTQTILFVSVAALALLLAWATRPAPTRDAGFADVGEPLTPELTDPADVGAIEVIAYDEELARHLAFQIVFDGARWVIPSAHDHPADAVDKIANAATAFIGLTREALVTDQRIDHAELGLLDPTDESANPEGRGVRVTIRARSGRTLTDLIVGDKVEKESGANQRFVRQARADRAYRTTFRVPLESTLSIDLTDWVDTDLLRLNPSDIARIHLDAYSVSESQDRRIEGEQIELTRDAGQGDWKLVSAEPVDQAEASDLTNAIAGLRFVGVEPVPKRLATLLTDPSVEASLTQEDVLRMESSGLYISPEGRLNAHAGELRLRTVDGLEYTLWFGKTLARTNFGGAVFSDETGPQAFETQPSSRATLITVAPVDPEDPDAAAAAETLSERFSSWWYLINERDFDRLQLTRESLNATPGDQPVLQNTAPTPEKPE